MVRVADFFTARGNLSVLYSRRVSNTQAKIPPKVSLKLQSDVRDFIPVSVTVTVTNLNEIFVRFLYDRQSFSFLPTANCTKTGKTA